MLIVAHKNIIAIKENAFALWNVIKKRSNVGPDILSSQNVKYQAKKNMCGHQPRLFRRVKLVFSAQFRINATVFPRGVFVFSILLFVFRVYWRVFFIYYSHQRRRRVSTL